MKIHLVILALMAGAVSAFAAEVPAAPARPSARDTAASRVQVTLISDDETWVSITNVQAPAKFQTKKVSLAPGDYEVIGRRRGYRDVQMRLQVRSGTAPQALKVICTVSSSGSR